MYKSGLIFGAVMLVLGLGVTLFLPYCVPCVALLVGLAAGYVAGVFAKPVEQQTAVRSGAIAGALGGIGVVLGEMIGAVINAAAIGPERIIEVMRQFGITTPTQMTPTEYWAAQLGINFCISLFSVALMAGLGALGGLIWWNMNGKKQVLPPPAL
jgi:asparagine N-glycosylation enzyme membrane subunit Stt3